MPKLTFWRISALLLSFSLLIAYVIVAGQRERPRIQASSKLRQIAIAGLPYADNSTTTPAGPATPATPPPGVLMSGSKYSLLGVAPLYADEPVEWSSLPTETPFEPSKPRALLPSSKVTADFSALLRAAGLAGPEAEVDSPATRPATLPAMNDRPADRAGGR